MTSERERAEAEAIDWVIRLQDPDFCDWDGFTSWLEGSPFHASIYDRVARADEDVATILEKRAEDVPANDDKASWVSPARRTVLGWSAAAAVAAVVGSYALMPGQSALETVSVAAGEHRSVVLPDGSSIALNGGTQLSYDRDGRFARLEHGEALFAVVHDDQNPFIVEAAGRQLVDAGTAFNVIVSGGELDVAVSDGDVIVEPQREAIALTAGEAVHIAGRTAVRRTIAPDDVASWRQGRLVYADAPLPLVASDLARNLGVDIRVSANAAGSRFTGTIQLDAEPRILLPVVGRLVGGEVQRVDGVWTIMKD